jgi:hypothetical protein
VIFTSGCLRLTQPEDSGVTEQGTSTADEATGGESAGAEKSSSGTGTDTDTLPPLRITDAAGLVTADETGLVVLLVTIQRAPGADTALDLQQIQATINSMATNQSILLRHASYGSGCYVEKLGNVEDDAELRPGSRAQVKIPFGESPAAKQYATEFAELDPVFNSGVIVNESLIPLESGSQVNVQIGFINDASAELRFTIPEPLSKENEPIALSRSAEEG